MKTRIRVLLHTASNISQNPLHIAEAETSIGSIVLLAREGNYRELSQYRRIVENTGDEVIGAIRNIDYQSIADAITNHFDKPESDNDKHRVFPVCVSFPKIITDPTNSMEKRILVTYNRGAGERNMLFLKIEYKESPG